MMKRISLKDSVKMTKTTKKVDKEDIFMGFDKDDNDEPHDDDDNEEDLL